MKKGDEAAMMANLAAQGITTVVSISSKGTVDTPVTEATGKLDDTPRGNRRAAGGKTTLVLG